MAVVADSTGPGATADELVGSSTVSVVTRAPLGAIYIICRFADSENHHHGHHGRRGRGWGGWATLRRGWRAARKGVGVCGRALPRFYTRAVAFMLAFIRPRER